MVDVDRSAITELVYRRLADPRFRERLTATAPDGTRPIVVALRDDPVRRVIAEVDALGGSGNVALPMLNGFVVFAVEGDEDAEEVDGEGHLITSECTVGVFFERLRMDGGQGAYRFVIEGPDHRREAGRAELVALGG